MNRDFTREQVISLALSRPQTCPECQAEITAAGEIGPARPRPGQFTICWQCDQFLRFDHSLQLRRITADDKRMIDRNPDLQKQLENLRVQIFVARTK